MFKNLLKSEFSKNVLTLLTGTTLAQLIPLLLMPVISRLFSPEEFGLFAFYFSIISFFLVIATGRYELAILMPKKDEDGMNLVALSFSILIVLCISLLSFIAVFHSSIMTWIDKPDLDFWIYFIPLCVFFASSYKILTYWSNRKKRFGKTSNSVITQATTRSGVLLYFGILKSKFIGGAQSFFEFVNSLFSKKYAVPSGVTNVGIGGFIISYLIGFGLSFVYLLANLLAYDRHLFKEISKGKMKELAKKYDKFPKINSLHAMTDEFKNSGVVFIISYAFSDIILGLYNMTYRVLRAPLSIIGNSFAQVFLQQAASMYANNQDFVPMIKKILKRLSLIAAPIFIVVLLFGPQIFEFVLGSKWRVSGVYAQYLTPWLFLQFITSPITQIAIVIHKQMELFYVSLINNAIILSAFIIGGLLFNSILYAFVILSLAQIVYTYFLYKWIVQISKNAIKV